MQDYRRYIIATKKNQIEIATSKLPSLKPDEVKVRSIVSGVSAGTEKRVLRREIPSFRKHWDEKYRIFIKSGKKKKFPTGLGYKIIGKVFEVGGKVKKVKIDDVVWVDGSHADISVVSEKDLVNNVLPRDIDPRIAVFLPSARIALGAVHDGSIKVGDFVAVVGMGVIGNLAAQISKLNGAWVVGIDNNKSKVNIAKKMSIEAYTNKGKDAVNLIRKKHFKYGADCVIEASGTYSGLSEAIRLCGVSGVVVTVGSYPTEKTTMNLGEEWQKNKIRMVSSMTVNDCPHSNYPLWDLARLNKTALSLLYKNKIDVLPLITHKYRFQQAKRAYQQLLNNPSVMEILFEYQ